MITLKYIMFEAGVNDGSGILRRIPIFFFEPLTHVGMYETMIRSRSDELPRDAELVSAGFVRIDRRLENVHSIQCYGISESLRDHRLPHTPLPDDAKIIQMHNHFHGIVI